MENKTKKVQRYNKFLIVLLVISIVWGMWGWRERTEFKDFAYRSGGVIAYLIDTYTEANTQKEREKILVAAFNNSSFIHIQNAGDIIIDDEILIEEKLQKAREINILLWDIMHTGEERE